MSETGITYLLWHDLVGVTRTRAVPTRDLVARAAHGLGWACAGQALTPFEDIVDNPWGPMDEARQIPDLDSRFTIPGDADNPEIAAVICNSMTAPGEAWDCCGRSFLKAALDDLEAETGLALVASFEHEFSIEAEGFVPQTPFSFAAARAQHAFLVDLESALTATGVTTYTIEPEYGLAQYEVACAPERGLRAADACLTARETIREVARRHGLAASFTPKPRPDAVGNGAHVHLSLASPEGRNETYDPEDALGLSPVAQRFSAGILTHLDALVALSAPTPISYYRLGPHHWSCGFRAIGLQNREAALRVVPGLGDAESRRRGHNLEFRPADGTASPYLLLGALVRAGLEGLRRDLPLMAPIAQDPADMTPEARDAAGITVLPASLTAALDSLEADAVARGWFSENLLATYLALKRWEASFAASEPEAEVFARYRSTY
ncbi:MAG: glutamine synthetase [Rhodospirillales bacterium]